MCSQPLVCDEAALFEVDRKHGWPSRAARNGKASNSSYDSGGPVGVDSSLLRASNKTPMVRVVRTPIPTPSDRRADDTIASAQAVMRVPQEHRLTWHSGCARR